MGEVFRKVRGEMSEEINERVLGRCEAFLTYSKKGIRFRDGEVVYVASVKSIKALLEGKTEKIYFAKFPYRKVSIEDSDRDALVAHCEKCGKNTVWRRCNEEKWKCENCGSEKTTTEIISGIRSIVEGF